MIDWSGIFHIMATPFVDDGALDTAGTTRRIPAWLDGQSAATLGGDRR